MAKRGYKLQEFVAHSSNVNCLSIGRKAGRLFITGGDDHKVNLWSIGKPTSLMSLCGHTSPVGSVAFDAAEVLVLAGSSAGAIKMWDLEEAKMVRTLTGHRSDCNAVEFHPFGEFFASGSADTNLRIWDIRKKGCIHTYKGHSQAISTIKFTPDGRWVVSGGFDNAVKVWDLTAGKLLHDFKFHEGPIRSLDFHPLEFLLATGSADRTVKFWDLETFELIGSARPEATGVRSMAFHPDGRTLFCGLDDNLKIYSWEPVICHDSVDMGWSTLGDLCIQDGKLLGCSYYHNTVGVWVADISLIEPYGTGDVHEENEYTEQMFTFSKTYSGDISSDIKSVAGLRSRSPEIDTKDIKNIYIDSSGGSPVALQRTGSLNSGNGVFPLDTIQTYNPPIEKQCHSVELNTKSGGQTLDKSFIAPTVVPQQPAIEKDSVDTKNEKITFSRTKPGMLLRPVRRASKSDIKDVSVIIEPVNLANVAIEKDITADVPVQTKIVLEEGTQKSNEEKGSLFPSVAQKSEKLPSPEKPPISENCDEPAKTIRTEPGFNVNGGDEADKFKRVNPVRIVNGVAVVEGRTRSLVERFERREKSSTEDQSPNGDLPVQGAINTPNITTDMSPHITAETDNTPVAPFSEPKPASRGKPECDGSPIPPSNTASPAVSEADKAPIRVRRSSSHGLPGTAPDMSPHVTAETDKTPVTPFSEPNPASRGKPESDGSPVPPSSTASPAVSEADKAPIRVRRYSSHGLPGTASDMSPHVTAETYKTPVTPFSEPYPASRGKPESDGSPLPPSNTASPAVTGADKAPIRVRRSSSHGLPGIHRSINPPSSTSSRAVTEVDRSHRRASSVGTYRTRLTSSAPTSSNSVPESEGTHPVASSYRNLSRTADTDISPFATIHKIPRDLPATGSRMTTAVKEEQRISMRGSVSANFGLAVASDRTSNNTPEMEKLPFSTVSRPRRRVSGMDRTRPIMKEEPQISIKDSTSAGYGPGMSSDAPNNTPEVEKSALTAVNRARHRIPAMDRTPPIVKGEPQVMLRECVSADHGSSAASNSSRSSSPEFEKSAFTTVKQAPRRVPVMDKSPPTANEEPQISGRDSGCGDVIEDLLQNHDAILSTLKSRLTKLQVIRHFWEQSDFKGAINAMRRLPDHSVGIDVQADVVGVLVDKIEIITLDLFSSLLPVLVGLLNSQMERHANTSLEMLLKLVAVFGPTIRSTVSAPRPVGVNLHAEERIDCCNQCFIELQKIQQILPSLVRKGGVLAKSARELNLVLQRP
ncbi:unnamed protein product [Linum trigynum]|uniref:Katanin p80 WD40 repeat-containing subunit B1 homolog n=1 Tax=Linum trigynum TaxID=586398 RepID=A0AAV2DGD1_9ROSI